MIWFPKRIFLESLWRLPKDRSSLRNCLCSLPTMYMEIATSRQQTLMVFFLIIYFIATCHWSLFWKIRETNLKLRRAVTATCNGRSKLKADRFFFDTYFFSVILLTKYHFSAIKAHALHLFQAFWSQKRQVLLKYKHSSHINRMFNTLTNQQELVLSSFLFSSKENLSEIFVRMNWFFEVLDSNKFPWKKKKVQCFFFSLKKTGAYNLGVWASQIEPGP